MFQRAHLGALGDSAYLDRCMVNGMKYAATDLGANVISLQKFLDVGWGFYDLIKGDKPYPPGAKITPDAGVDGRMIGLLWNSGFRTLHIDRCLFSHAPNPWMCKQQGGVGATTPRASARPAFHVLRLRSS